MNLTWLFAVDADSFNIECSLYKENIQIGTPFQPLKSGGQRTNISGKRMWIFTSGLVSISYHKHALK